MPEKTDEEDPHFFAVQDNGDSGEYLFKVPIDGQVGASAAVDPMGRGVWFTARQGPFSLLNKAGQIIQEIDIASFSEVDADSKASVVSQKFCCFSIEQLKHTSPSLATAKLLFSSGYLWQVIAWE
jgi:hypothetical protein